MLKPIETSYKGYRFRQRLEARWAVFFDAYPLTWRYEPEEFELPNGERYLPDFWLPSPVRKFPAAGYWIEVKPCPPSSSEIECLRLLCVGTKHHGFFFTGEPGENHPIAIRFETGTMSPFLRNSVSDSGYALDKALPIRSWTEFGLSRGINASRAARFD